MSKEGPKIEGVPPPGPQRVEGGGREETRRRKELQSFRTHESTRCCVFKDSVSVPVLPGEGW